MKILEGNLIGKSLKVGIVSARFNEFIVSRLISGAVDGLKRHGVEEEDIEIAYVPGAFEIPMIAKQMVHSKKYDAIIALGCVIKGATPHFDYVCAEVSKGIATIGMENDIPVIFGVITTNSIEQAIERAGTKSGNKGYDSAIAAIEMINLMKQI